MCVRDHFGPHGARVVPWEFRSLSSSQSDMARPESSVPTITCSRIRRHHHAFISPFWTVLWVEPVLVLVFVAIPQSVQFTQGFRETVRQLLPLPCSWKVPEGKVGARYCSSGASGGCLHGGASFEVESAHFTARQMVRRTANNK